MQSVFNVFIKFTEMDSFLSLFDPCLEDNSEDLELNNVENGCSLPPEPQVGNIEYKLKIVNPSKQRFEHLVTQVIIFFLNKYLLIKFKLKMKWRLREGQGEAIYEIGVEDNGVLTGLTHREMTASLQTLEQMAIKLGASTTILRKRVLDNGRNVAEILVRKVFSYTVFLTSYINK